MPRWAPGFLSPMPKWLRCVLNCVRRVSGWTPGISQPTHAHKINIVAQTRLDGPGLPHAFVHVALGPLRGVTYSVACTRGVP